METVEGPEGGTYTVAIGLIWGRMTNFGLEKSTAIASWKHLVNSLSHCQLSFEPIWIVSCSAGLHAVHWHVPNWMMGVELLIVGRKLRWDLKRLRWRSSLISDTSPSTGVYSSSSWLGQSHHPILAAYWAKDGVSDDHAEKLGTSLYEKKYFCESNNSAGLWATWFGSVLTELGFAVWHGRSTIRSGVRTVHIAESDNLVVPFDSSWSL